MSSCYQTGLRRKGRRRTKIVCTIGPSSSTDATIEKLVRAGMDCARLNFSHGTPAEHFGFIEKVRRVCKMTGRRVAVMQDLPGPKLRVGRLKGGSVQITKGSTVSLTTEPSSGGTSMIPKLRKSKIIWGVYQVVIRGAGGYRSSAELVRRHAEDRFVRQGDSVVAVCQAAASAKGTGLSLSISSAPGKKR